MLGFFVDFLLLFSFTFFFCLFVVFFCCFCFVFFLFVFLFFLERGGALSTTKNPHEMSELLQQIQFWVAGMQKVRKIT